MTSQDLRKLDLPDTPGVYFFKTGKEILYVGKATSLHDRIKSYFSNDLTMVRGLRIAKMVQEADKIECEQTDSVLEALILEANYIKKFQPPYNVREKDDKSYNYVVIIKEKFPRVLTMRQKELFRIKNKELGIKNESTKLLVIPYSSFAVHFVAGPFPHGAQLKEALKIIRKIFPFRDKCSPSSEQHTDKLENVGITSVSGKTKVSKPCFNRQIGLCPGVCTGEISQKDYAKTIRNIILFFSGKKREVVKNLEREMREAAKALQFEKADELRRKIFALEHIQDVSLLKRTKFENRNAKLEDSFRIEAYDIAHSAGAETVGVMVVAENSELEGSEYRKFKIRGTRPPTGQSRLRVSIDDITNLKEVLVRRLGHAEWPLPQVIVVDGGGAQRNIAREVLAGRGFNIEVVSVVKNEKHRPKEVLGKKGIIENHTREILLVNAEAHRFAVSYHRRRMRKGRLAH
ncbi:hypothetical protein EPN83_00400 [Patescibacteria group bacterium]|nr:MAG: hypothetical protein EPN83_00400 [Patescibacteria group bacterium]